MAPFALYLFLPVDPIVTHHDLLAVDDPKSFFSVPG